MEVAGDLINIEFPPFMSPRKIDVEDISSFEARAYNPMKEYGGWGIRGGRKNRAYNVSGNRGVQLVLNNGNRVLIGSAMPDELADAIGTAKRR